MRDAIRPSQPWHRNPSRRGTRPVGTGRPANSTSRAAGAILGDLADLGMDAAWIGLPASAVGAPYPRFRVFILAYLSLIHI